MASARDPVDRAIERLWQRYAEPLTLPDIAAPLSRSYFARTFRDATGVTPGRFLAAIRIAQAKQLLAGTTRGVADIAFSVGYASVTSFTSAFTAGVGIPPGRFRRLAGGGGTGLPVPGRGSGTGSIAGTITLPAGHGAARVYVGAHPTPLVEHPAAAAVILDVAGNRPCCYTLPGVPAGTWVVRAVGVAAGVGPAPDAARTPLAGRHDAVVVGPGTVTSAAVRLHAPRLVDPPVLLALPDLTPPPAAAAPACPAVAPRPGLRRPSRRSRTG